ncbi:MAG: BatD family protein [Porticoccaceae bacterium]|nr:BatD family protein [Porticoccaceae bacterium]
MTLAIHSGLAKITRRMASVALLLIFCSNSYAALTASIDRNLVYDNESVQLTIRLDAQVGGVKLDVSVLNSDFEIISNNRQQQYTVSNGRAESSTEWNLVLIPRRAGNLVIPSLNLRGDISDALELEVRSTAGNSTAAPIKQAIFAETLVDKDRVYVQEQVLLTLRLYTSVSLTDYSLTPIAIDGATVQQVAENQYQKRVDGRDYLVIEVRYAVFPQNSGELTIPAQRFGAFEAPRQRQFGGFRQRGNQVLRNTEIKTIKVSQRPTQIAGNQWMPSTQVELTETWSGDLGKLRVGEPVTRSITVTAEGLTGAQIHPLDLAAADEYRVYPDQAQLETRNTDNGTLGVRIESMALVASREGQIQLPALEVVWWNTRTGRSQVTILESRVLNIAAASVSLPLTPTKPLRSNAEERLSVPTTDTYDQDVPHLLWLSLSANALLLSTLVGLVLWRTRRGKKLTTKGSRSLDKRHLTLKQLLKAIRHEARKNDLLAMRHSILQWGHVLFPEAPPQTLHNLAEVLQDHKLKTQFAELDAYLYDPQTTSKIDVDGLLGQLTRQTVQPTTKQPNGERPLQPLYPKSNSR